MEKFYLVNRETAETFFCESSNDAFTEAQKRNKIDPFANWKAYTTQGDVIYGLVVVRV